MGINVKELIENNKIVILFFFSNCCVHCDEIKEKIISTEFNVNINFIQINIDTEKDLALKYSITHTPTTLVFKDSELIYNIVGNSDCIELIKNLFLL